MRSRTGWWLLVFCASGCQRPAHLQHADPAEGAAPQGTASAAQLVPGACFIGPLFENQPDAHSRPSEYCVDDVRYTGASHRLGRRNVFGATGSVDDGGYVRVQASEQDDLYAALTRTGACESGGGPMPQMRSDWPPEEGTYHTTVERLRSASYLQATSVTALDLVTLDGLPDDPHPRGEPVDAQAVVKATIRNPLQVPLEGLTLVFHYEGGRRKPMPRYREQALPTTAPGSETPVTVPLAFEEDGAWYWFASLSIEGTAGGCTFVSSTFLR